MEVIVLDPDVQKDLIEAREASETDKYDEVWDGVYMIMPLPNDEHQEITTKLSTVLTVSLNWTGLGEVRAGVNISDREEGWKENYREPDVAVFLQGTTARNLDTHWVDGPDFVVEVVSPQDRARQKLGFYASVHVRELLLIDRAPWVLELYRLDEGVLRLVGTSSLDQPAVLTSEVLPLSFRLVPGDARPRIEVAHRDGVQRWLV